MLYNPKLSRMTMNVYYCKFSESLGRCNTHVLCNLLVEGLETTYGGKTKEKSVTKEKPMLKEDVDDKENQTDVGEKEKDKEQSKVDKKVQQVGLNPKVLSLLYIYHKLYHVISIVTGTIVGLQQTFFC